MATQILSSPVLPPIFPRQNINRGVQQGGRNQQDQLFALLSFMSQQQRQEDTLGFRNRQQEESERRNRAEEERHESALSREDARLRMSASHKRTDKRVTKEQGRAYRKEVREPYESSYDQVFATLRPTLKGLNSKSTETDVNSAVRILAASIDKERGKGGFHSYGAITAGSDLIPRILIKVPRSVDNEVLQNFNSRFDEKVFRSKIVPLALLRQFAPTTDEFRLRHESIFEQGEVQKRNVTDIILRPSPIDAAGQRKAQKEVRAAETFSFDRSPITVEPVSTDDPDKVTGFSQGLNAPSTTPEEDLGFVKGFEKSTQEVQSGILAPGGRAVDRPTVFGEAGRQVGAFAAGIPSAAVTLLEGIGGIMNPELETIRALATGTHGPPRRRVGSLFGDMLEKMEKQQQTQTLTGIAAESDSITQRGTPPLSIGQDPFFPRPSQGLTPAEFLRMLQGETGQEGRF